jgi:hypothetical protein
VQVDDFEHWLHTSGPHSKKDLAHMVGPLMAASPTRFAVVSVTCADPVLHLGLRLAL